VFIDTVSSGLDGSVTLVCHRMSYLGLTGRFRALVRQERPLGQNVLNDRESYSSSPSCLLIVWARTCVSRRNDIGLFEGYPIDWEPLIGSHPWAMLRFFAQD
jgi:hypothetical protein